MFQLLKLECFTHPTAKGSNARESPADQSRRGFDAVGLVRHDLRASVLPGKISDQSAPDKWSLFEFISKLRGVV
jgi:hypothetical protein